MSRIAEGSHNQHPKQPQVRDHPRLLGYGEAIAGNAPKLVVHTPVGPTPRRPPFSNQRSRVLQHSRDFDGVYETETQQEGSHHNRASSVLSAESHGCEATLLARRKLSEGVPIRVEKQQIRQVANPFRPPRQTVSIDQERPQVAQPSKRRRKSP